MVDGCLNHGVLLHDAPGAEVLGHQRMGRDESAEQCNVVADVGISRKHRLRSCHPQVLEEDVDDIRDSLCIPHPRPMSQSRRVPSLGGQGQCRKHGDRRMEHQCPARLHRRGSLALPILLRTTRLSHWEDNLREGWLLVVLALDCPPALYALHPWW